MDAYRSRLVLLVLLLASFALAAGQEDFEAARKKIEAAKPLIDYARLCSEMPVGHYNIVCRIKEMPSVAFLVCTAPHFEREGFIFPCAAHTHNGLKNNRKLRDADIKTVTVSPPPIDGVKCGVYPSIKCSGFLQKWVDKSDGVFQQVRDHISNGTVDKLIKTVTQLTKGGLARTAADLSNVVKYMDVNQAGKPYRQVCDFQGFFLVDGGFLVGDTPYIAEGIAIDQRCWDGEPTTKQVLDALNSMIEAFSQLKGPAVI